MASRTTRISLQLLLVVGAWVLAGMLPGVAFWIPVASYGVLWLVCNLVARRASGFDVPLSRGAVVASLLTLAVVSGLSLWERRTDLAWSEGLKGLGQHFSDRHRIEKLPSIAPPIVFTDHPQAFYVHAPEASRVSWRFGEGGGEGGPVLDGQSLGQGLFRILYDPRQQGLPPGEMENLSSILEVDGKRYPRKLLKVRPEAHPRWFASAPAQGIAAAASEETDEVFLVSRQGLEERWAVGDGPTEVTFLEQGKVLAVAHRYSSELLFLDVATGEKRGALPLGPFQTHLAVDPSGGFLAVAFGGLKPRVEVVSTRELSVVGSFPLEEKVDGLLFGRTAEEILVASRSSKTLSLWRWQTKVTGGPPQEIGGPPQEIGDSIGDSIGGSIGDSIGGSIGDSIGGSIGDSIGGS
ncbi:MAG: hypothetical protein K0U98_15865, partial [Deltaproteobacteria bacterium]|nr:hypothetical protein [Deltaproteobacteria bacterium]